MYSNKLTSIIKYLIYLLALTPLIVTPFTIFPFNFGRGLVIQLLIELIFGFYVILAFYDKKYQPKFNTMTWLLGFFLFILYISSLFGVDFHKSFWSNEQRFDGLFYLSHIFIFFVIISAVFKSKKEWHNFLGFSALVAVLAFLIALPSYFGVKFWGIDLGTRISGTLGNPIFLASYLILNLIFSLYLLFSIKNRNSRIFYFFLSLILFCAIILTQSMGAYFGLISGIVAGALFYGVLVKRRKEKIILAVCVFIAIILCGSVFIFKKNEFIKNNEILNRIANISISEGTGSTRFIFWEIAGKAILDRPVFGWGAEGYKVAFSKFYKPELLKYSYYETWADKPHNKILGIATEAGLIGLIAYFSIFIYSSFLIWRKGRSELPLASFSVLFGGLAAYFIQNLFAFDTIVSYLMFFILLGFISFNCKESAGSNKKISWPIVFVFMPIVFLSACFLNISPILASNKFQSAVPLFDVRQKVDLNRFKDDLKYFNPYKKEWITDLAKNMISSLRRKEYFYSDEELEFSLNLLEGYVKKHPNSVYERLLLGIFYGELGVKNNKYFELAKSELNKALELSPKRQHIYFAYGRIYALTNEKEKCLDVFNEAIKLEPIAPLSYWEAGKQFYILDSEDDFFKEYLVKSAELDWVPEEDNEFLFLFNNTHDYFIEKENYKILFGYYQKMKEIEPSEVKWRAKEAVAAYYLKQYERAIELIKEAIEMDDSYKEEGEQFISAIENEIKDKE